MDIAAAKDEINLRLDREIMDGTDVAPDRLKNEDSFKPILDEVAKEGWALTEPERGLFKIRRTYIVEVTRLPVHQALVEGRGEVAIGDNTYTHPRGRSFFIGETFRYDTVEGAYLTSGFEITDAIMAKGIACLWAHAQGPKPTVT